MAEVESKKKSILGCGFAVLGFILLILGALSFTVVKSIIRTEVIKKVLLVNGTEGYQLWQEPPIPIRFQVWAFNVTNAADVSRGGKPNVTQRGPYTYREHRVKFDINHHDNGTVSYRQRKTYHFVREESVGWDNETFTTVNIPYMTLVTGFQYQPKYLQDTISFLLNEIFPKEDVFLNRSVRDIVWGYTDPILHWAKFLDKKIFNQETIGVMEGKNDTDDGVYTVFTGEKDIRYLGVIDRYNGANSVNYWTSCEANMVNGTDGTVAPPFIPKSLVLRMFSTDICRSVYGTYHGEVSTLAGVKLYRFTAPREALAAPSHNPDNAGFCTPAGNCLGDGVLNISTCQIVDTFHLPIGASSPHFYMADQRYVDAVDGMHPKKEEHATNIDVEPNTGLVMQIEKKLQINVFLKPDKSFSKTKSLREIVFPVVWFNESALTDLAHAEKLKRELLVPKAVLNVFQYVITILGAVLLLCVVCAVILHSMRPQKPAWVKGNGLPDHIHGATSTEPLVS